MNMHIRTCVCVCECVCVCICICILVGFLDSWKRGYAVCTVDGTAGAGKLLGARGLLFGDTVWHHHSGHVHKKHLKHDVQRREERTNNKKRNQKPETWCRETRRTCQRAPCRMGKTASMQPPLCVLRVCVRVCSSLPTSF